MRDIMKKILCIILCVVMFMLGACTTNVVSAESESPLTIFGYSSNGYFSTSVVVDEETGVNYVVVSAPSRSNSSKTEAIAITPRINADGTPYVC